ncbi:MAG: fibronectin type III domain-containing protein [Acidimicrobiales bacterium]|nr:fibronectin type III domain-containing protein [Acidimicrobiales bacterium]
MFKTRPRWRRAAAALAGAAVVAAGAPFVGAGVAAAATPSIVSVGGGDPTPASISVSQATYPQADSAGAVIVMRNDTVVDALSASALAGAYNAPILATPTNSLDPAVSAEIQRVIPPNGTIFVMGGTAAISAAVEQQLDQIGGTVQRLQGVDRYATSATTATFLGATDGAKPFDGAPTAILANGVTVVDALGVGPIAYQGHAVLLTDGSTLTTPVQQALQAIGARQLIVVGGSAVMSPSLVSGLQGTFGVIQEAGIDRWQTAADLATIELQILGFTNSRLVISPGVGTFFPTMFAGYHAGKVKAPMVLVNAPGVPTETALWVQQFGANVTTLVAVGVDAGTAQAVANLIGGINPATPGAPSAVGATQSGAASVSVSWRTPSNPSNSPITNYTVTVSPSTGVSGGTQRNTNSAVNQLNFTGLSQGVAYTFTVQAQNGNGIGPASNPSAPVTINPTPPPAPPAVTNLQARVDANQDEVFLTWDAPPPGVILQGYNIYILQNGTQVDVEETSTTGWNISGCSYGGFGYCLTEGVPYAFQVAAISQAGVEGPRVTSNSVTLPPPGP